LPTFTSELRVTTAPRRAVEQPQDQRLALVTPPPPPIVSVARGIIKKRKFRRRIRAFANPLMNLASRGSQSGKAAASIRYVCVMDFAHRNPPRNISGYSIHVDALAETLLGMLHAMHARAKRYRYLYNIDVFVFVSTINIDPRAITADGRSLFRASLLIALLLSSPGKKKKKKKTHFEFVSNIAGHREHRSKPPPPRRTMRAVFSA
jgi:hypothetical protein